TFFFQAEDGIRDRNVTGVQTCALPISTHDPLPHRPIRRPTMTSRFTRRSLLGGAAAGAAALTLPACSRFTGGGDQTLLMSSSQSETSPIVQCRQKWSDAVTEQTEGALTVEVHAPGSTSSAEVDI